MAMLEIRDLNVYYGGIHALKGISLEVEEGQIVSMIGSNGAGKSSMMNAISGIVKYKSGEILYKGKRVAFSSPNQANHAGICMIPQEVNMVETMDAAENVWLHREKRFSTCGFINKKKRLLATQELFDRMHLNLDPKKLVAQYSSAQKQMLAIAKAVSQDSEVIIMDEPTSSLS